MNYLSRKIIFSLACCISLFFTACHSSAKETPSTDFHFANYRAPENKKTNSPKPVEFGYLRGTFLFPSDAIPEDLRVVAHNVETGEEVVTTYQNKPMYELKVPVGQYFVYAETSLMPEYRAYFTEFVTCGLSIDCPSHTKIMVVVHPNIKLEDINPADWYNVE